MVGDFFMPPPALKPTGRLDIQAVWEMLLIEDIQLTTTSNFCTKKNMKFM